MPDFLHKRVFVFLLISLFSSLAFIESRAQGCSGADGSGIFIGSIANRDNGTRCANQRGQSGFTPGTMEIDISNIDESVPLIEFQIDWDDGSPFQNVTATKIGSTRYFATITHEFPDAGANVRCEYRPVVRLRLNGAVCSANLGTPPRFVRWNTDNQNTGVLQMSETATGAVEYQVCEGVETNVTFTDRTTLNCVPPDLINGPNNFTRWRQFVYGTTNTITGTVRIGGTPRTFPFNGAVDQSANPVLNSGFPTATTQIITVPATAKAGEVFELKMNYWNTCNSYALGKAPVETFGRIRVVAQPVAPTPNPAVENVCRGTTPTNPTINAVPGSNTILWYRNGPGDTPGTLITSGTNLFSIPIASVPGYTNNTTAGTYKVWVSYRPTVANALNCESPKVMITRTIRNSLNVPDPIVGFPAEVCQGATFSITMPATTPETFGGANEYQFPDPGSGLTRTANTATTATYSTAGVTFGSGVLFVDRTITVRIRYSDGSPTCSRGRDFVVRIWRNPVGGTLDDFPNVCEGTAIGPINLTGHLGTSLQWQRSTNGGAFANIAGATAASWTEPAPLPAGTYQYRVVVTNGSCGSVLSSVETVVVSPSPPFTIDAGPDQELCNVLSTALAGTDPTPFGLTGTWTYVRSEPSGRPAPTISNVNNHNATLSIADASRAGAYIMRWTVVSGTCTFVDEVTIDFGFPPVLSAMANIQSCVSTATLAAAPLTSGNGVWTVTGGPVLTAVTINDPASPTSGITHNGTDFGTYTLTWTVTSGACPAEDESVNVTFFQAPTVSATDINGVCLLPTGTVVGLTGTIGGGAPSSPVGTWEIVTGTGSISNIVNAAGTVTADYNATATDYNNGTDIRVRIKSTIGLVCPTAEQEISINVDKTPIPDAGTNPLPSCDNFATLNAAVPVNATGMWTGAGVTFDDPTDPHTVVRNLPAPPGAVTLTWTLTSTGGNSCVAADNVTVDTYAKPTVTNYDPLLCEVLPAGALRTDVTLSDFEDDVTGDPTNTIQWFRNGPPPLGTPIANGAIPITGVQEGDVFVARVSNANCSDFAYVSINVRPLPVAIDATISLCEDAVGTDTHANVDLTNNMYKNAVTSASNNVTWFTTLADATNNNAAGEIVAPFDVVGNQTVFARIVYPSGISCPIVSELSLVVDEIPNVAGIIGDQTVCMGSNGAALETLPIFTYQVNAIPGAKYNWNIPQGAGEFLTFGGGGQSDFFVLVKFPYSATPVNPLDISVTIDNNGCTTPLISLPITRNARPVAPTLSGDPMVCENSASVPYGIVGPNASSDYIWEIRKQSDNSLGGAVIASGQTDPNIFVDFGNEAVTISVSEQNGVCAGPAATVNVGINLLPVMSNMNVAVCSQLPSNIALAVDGGSVAAPTFTVKARVEQAGINFTGLPSIPPDLSGGANVIQNDVFENKTGGPLNVVYTVVPVSAAGCAGVSKIVTLQVNPEPQMEVNLGKDLCSEELTDVVLRTATGKASADEFIIESIDNPGGLVGTGIPNVGDVVDLNGIRNNSWENTSGAAALIRYNIRPRNSGTTCVGASTPPIEFMIHSKPIFAPVVNPAEICSETTTGITVNVSNMTASIAWTLDYVGPNILGPTAGFTATPPAQINNVLTNSSTSVVDFVRYRILAENVVVAGVKSCFSDPLLMQVNVNPLPAVTPPVNLQACADAPGNGLIASIDLTSLNNGIALPANASIIWYPADPSGGPVSPVPSPTAHPMQNGVPVYAEVTSTLPSGCKDIVQVSYVVHEAVSLSLSETDVTCAGRNDGAIQITALTGTGNFNYQLNSNPAINAPSPFTFDNLAPSGAPGYDINVTDRNGCSATATGLVITQPQTLSASETHTAVSCFFDSQSITDRNGSIIVNAVGGPSAPDQNDPNSVGSYIFTLQPGNIQNTNGSFTNLRPGVYTVRVADANPAFSAYCFDDLTSITIAVPTPIEVSPVSVVTDSRGNNISCFGANDGEFSVSASGGTGGFTFTLDPTAATTSQPANTPAVFTNLAPGVYKVNIVDGNGCKAPQTSAFISPMIDMNPGLIGSDQNVCPENPASLFSEIVQPYGGTGAYEYQWQVSTSTGDVNDPAQWFNIPGANSSVYDPNLNLDRNQPQMHYRRLVRDVTDRANPHASCLTFTKGFDKKVTVRNLPTPVVQLVGNPNVCEGKKEFVYIEMLTAQGTPPMTFDVFDGDITRLNQSGGQKSGLYEIMNPDQGPTISFTNIKDAFGCAAADQTLAVALVPKPTFSVNTPTQCAGGQFEFTHTVDPNLDYEWSFGDNTTQSYQGVTPAPLPIVKTYAAGSTSAETKYVVRLTAFGACLNHFDEKIITVYPTISRNIIEPSDQVCEGETITFEDKTQGVNTATWQLEYVDDLGNTVTLPEQVYPIGNVTFAMTNPTNQNPLAYTIYYTAKNNYTGPNGQPCQTQQTLGPILVYQKPVADFTHTPAAPQMVGGVMDVSYTIQNYDNTTFDYSWSDPGMAVVPGSEILINDTRSIKYAEEKDINVTLFVVNNAYDQCFHSAPRTIPIQINTPQASFLASPLAGCFPITVTTDNTSVSYDNFEWTLTSTTGSVEKSNLAEPEFRISTPGVYTLTMLARKTGTALPPELATPRTITVFEVPVADFLLRLRQVFVGEVVEPINRSQFALSYEWDFGDGTTSNEVQPQHRYTLEGRDSITLIASYDRGVFDIDGDGINDGNVVCRDTTKQAINVVAGGALKIPNAFTPSANGPNSGREDVNFTNDVFLPIMDGVEEFTMQIFDRWGTLVFQSQDKNIGWNGYDRNGRLMPAGVYVFKLVMRLTDGQRTTKVGDITLIR
jgi:gliding motility-associated-like protein